MHLVFNLAILNFIIFSSYSIFWPHNFWCCCTLIFCKHVQTSSKLLEVVLLFLLKCHIWYLLYNFPYIIKLFILNFYNINNLFNFLIDKNKNIISLLFHVNLKKILSNKFLEKKTFLLIFISLKFKTSIVRSTYFPFYFFHV